jgi:hypothetical protein
MIGDATFAEMRAAIDGAEVFRRGGVPARRCSGAANRASPWTFSTRCGGRAMWDGFRRGGPRVSPS